MSELHSRWTRRLKVAVLCSHGAPGLVQLLNHDARRGIDYEIDCCITSSDTFAEEVRVERRGVTCLPHSIRNFCRVHGADPHDMAARAAYDAITLELLAPFNPDLLVLLDYQFLLTPGVLDRFRGRIISLHQDVEGPAAERQGRVTAHVVTGRPFEGRVILRSWSFPVSQASANEQEAEAAGDVPGLPDQRTQRAAWAATLTRVLELAGSALERPGTALNLATIGQWELTPDGTMRPVVAQVASAAASASGRW